MGWGTDFKADVFLNRQVFANKYEVEEAIREKSNDIIQNEVLLLGYAMATPKDIFPNSDDVAFDVKLAISEVLENLSELHVDRYKLSLYLESTYGNNT